MVCGFLTQARPGDAWREIDYSRRGVGITMPIVLQGTQISRTCSVESTGRWREGGPLDPPSLLGRYRTDQRVVPSIALLFDRPDCPWFIG